MSNILISKKTVEEFLTEDTTLDIAKRDEIMNTLSEIEAKEGRKWVFTPQTSKFYIDEYNQYNDFVKTYIFKNGQ